MIVQKLREIQNERGYLPDDELVKLSKDTGTPLYRLQEVASFFPHFRQEWNKPPEVEVKICRDMACHLAGASRFLHAPDSLKQLESPGKVEIVGTSCLGRCDRAPAVCVSRHDHHDHSKSFHDRVYAGLSEKDLRITLDTIIAGDSEVPEDTPDITRNISNANWKIDVYALDPDLADKPYAVAKRYLAAFPAVVPQPTDPSIRGNAKALAGYIREKHPWLAQLDVSNLQGMGGAGMKAYEKWRDVWGEPAPIKYIVCNGDESEPGTFKDRELLLFKPHLVVEGVILAGLITGATKGYIYIRHEYREQINGVRAEIERARAEGVCGRLTGTNRYFDVEVYESPGGYICGEQTALIEAMEDKRSQPRNRPPELQTNGLFDKPTVVNNVETLAWAPAIMHRGGPWYAGEGRPNCKGRRFFSISGDLNKPGVFEVPNGITLGELIALAGGVKGGPLQAVATSGPSGGFIPARLPVEKDVRKRLDRLLGRFKDRDTGELSPDGKLINDFAEKHLVRANAEARWLDIQMLPLDLNFFRNVGTLLGMSDFDMMLGGGLVVYNSTRDMLEQARNSTQFFRNESCGKCVPCRIGSQKLVEIGTELLKRQKPSSIALNDADGEPPAIPAQVFTNVAATLGEYGNYLRQTAICGLGAVAPNPLIAAAKFFMNGQSKE